MRSKLFWTIAVGLAAPGGTALAAAPGGEGLSFQHHDWELACDNTRTCRAAGYQAEGVEPALSLLLTRKAGPGEAVSGELALGSSDEDSPAAKLPPGARLTLKIDGKAVGQVELPRGETHAVLPVPQVAALLPALTGSSRITWEAGGQRWELSGKGASAVLLKMDDFQGRVGTSGALVRKGGKGEDGVLAPLPMPVVRVPALPAPRPGDAQEWKTKEKALLQALRAAPGAEDCPDLEEAGQERPELSLVRLSETRLLLSTRCWRAAYNEGYGYWVVSSTAPFKPRLVTASGTEFSEGIISAAHKGRGLGDCWSSAAWAWNGEDFVLSESATTGMCRLVEAGGPWSLPTRVSEVRQAAR